MSCIFCGIAKGEIPSYKIGENEGAIAFLDINPHALGHTVVVPKAHAKIALEAAEFEWTSVFLLINDCMFKLKEKLGAEGFNVGWNEGDAGGQLVGHWHVHIFPRYSGDGGGSMHSIIKTRPEIGPAEVYKKIVG